MPERSDRTAWPLVALAHRKGQALTPVQIQKALFVLGRELPTVVRPRFYSFKPYNYGPFGAVYHDSKRWQRLGFIRRACYGSACS
jgi:hypothetical protein